MTPVIVSLAAFGGALALYCGLRYRLKLGGIIGLSTYLPLADTLAKERNLANQDTPIMLAHGAADDLLPLDFGDRARVLLTELGYSVEWHTYPQLTHGICLEEIEDIRRWLGKMI